MNQTNIDYLYQVFTPAAERSPGASRAESQTVGFGEHLNQASTSVFDVVHAPRHDDTRQTTSSLVNRGVEPNSARPATTDNATSVRSNSSDSKGDSTAGPSCSCETTDSQTDDSNAADHDKHDDGDRDNSSLPGSDATAQAAAATNAQAPQRSANETKADKEHVSSADEAAVKAATDELVESTRATGAAKATGESQTDTSTGTAITEEIGGNETLGEIATTSLNNTPERTGDTTKEHKAFHERAGKKVPAEDIKTEGSEISSAGKQVVSTATAEQTTASDDATKENVSTKRRTDAARGPLDDDSPCDGENAADKSSAQGVDRTPNTPIVTAVSNGQSTVDADAASSVAKTDDDKTAIKPSGNKTETAMGPLGKSLRSAVEMTRGQKPASGSDAPQVDPARFVSRVAKAIHTANERGGDLQLRLAPPELGTLKIELNIKDGVMSAALEADNASARRLLLDHLPTLRERLAEQNIRIERFDVDVRQDDTSGQSNSRGSNQHPFQQQAEQQNTSRRASSLANGGELATPEPTIIATRITNTAINLVV